MRWQGNQNARESKQTASVYPKLEVGPSFESLSETEFRVPSRGIRTNAFASKESGLVTRSSQDNLSSGVMIEAGQGGRQITASDDASSVEAGQAKSSMALVKLKIPIPT